MRTFPLASFLAATVLVATLPCQASFTTFGTGCSLQGRTPSIGHAGLPRLGQTFSITYVGPNYTYNSAQQIAQPYLALGFQPLVTTIPAGLLIYQPAGCTGYLAPIAVIPMLPHATQPKYESSYAMTVPSHPGLVGVQFLAQWLLAHTQCGFAGCGYSAFITSDAATVMIGP